MDKNEDRSLEEKYGLNWVNQSLKVRTAGMYEEAEAPKCSTHLLTEPTGDDELIAKYSPGIFTLGEVLALTKTDILTKDPAHRGNLFYITDKFGLTTPVFVWWVDNTNNTAWGPSGWALSDATLNDRKPWSENTAVVVREQ